MMKESLLDVWKKEYEDRITELEQINGEHQKLNGELREENERLKKDVELFKSDLISCTNTALSLITKIDKAIEYINWNKQKTIGAYWDNFEICLSEEDIDNLLNILQNGGYKK